MKRFVTVILAMITLIMGVTASFACGQSVSVPTAGQICVDGNTVVIRWTSRDVRANYEIKLVDNRLTGLFIATNTIGTACGWSYKWLVNADSAGTGFNCYQILVVNARSQKVVASSGLFSIELDSNLYFTSPNGVTIGGEADNWKPGDAQSFGITTKGLIGKAVTVTYVNTYTAEEYSLGTVAITKATQKQVLGFQVKDLPLGLYTLAATTAAGDVAISGSFAVVPNSLPLTVQSPVNGSSISYGSGLLVRWTGIADQSDAGQMLHLVAINVNTGQIVDWGWVFPFQGAVRMTNYLPPGLWTVALVGATQSTQSGQFVSTL